MGRGLFLPPRGGGSSRAESSGGGEGLEAVVALAHAGLHAGCHHAVARLERRVDGVAREAAATVAEVLEAHRLDAHGVGVAEELEGLDGELVLANRVEHAPELVGVALRVAVHVAPGAAG